MAKDPAVLWYFNDWHGGTSTLSRFIKGCYMDVLHAQFNNGHLSLQEIQNVLGTDFNEAWPILKKKFKQDENELLYNERLIFEIQKRKKYTKSRVKNLNGGKDGESEGNDKPEAAPTKKAPTNLIDFFFQDLPNSSYLIKIASTINVPIDELKNAIPDFRKHANLEYQNMIKFSEHFKNWYLLKLKNGQKEQKTTTTSLKFGNRK